MARKDRDSNRRGGRKTWVVDEIDGNERNDKKYDHIVTNLSAGTEDSSLAHGSELGSENSRYTSDDDSASSGIVGSSSDSESYLSSVLDDLELGADTQELLENDELLTTLSYESRQGMVGGWLDFACGWMDKPNLCAMPLVGGSQTSLLRQSKAAKAIQRVKLNETFKKAADNASASYEKKNKSDVERIQRDVAKAAAAAAETVRKQEIQPSELPLIREEKDDNDFPRKKEFMRVYKSVDDRRDEEIEAKMKQVSARAAEILKNTIEARAKTPKEEHAQSSPQILSHVDLRKKVFDQLARDRGTSSDEDSLLKSEPSHTSVDTNVDQVVQQEARELSTSPVRSAQSVVARETSDSTVATGEIVHVEEVTIVAGRTQAPEDDEIESLNGVKRSASPSSPSKEQESPDSDGSLVATIPSITDLTHIDDDNDNEEAQGDSNNNKRSEHQESPQTPKSIRKATPKRSARLAALHRNDLGKRDSDFIDVFELDDEDSWTPGERRDHTPSRSNRDSHQDNFVDRRSADRSPIKSTRASLFGANVPTDDIQEEQRRTQRAPRDASFNDPRAREAFAGLRRGRLGTGEELHDRKSEELAERDDIIEAEVALMRSKSRESRQLRNMAMASRQRVTEATFASNMDDIRHSDSSSRRSSHLIAVRSIDEAQRLRNERAREMHDSAIHRPKSRERPRESAKYSHLTPATPENPMDVHQYLKSRMPEHELASRSYHQQYDSRTERRPSTGRQSSGRDQESYNSVIINRSKSRDGNSEYVEERGTDRYTNDNNGRGGLLRGRDMRDDSDTMYNSNRNEPSNYINLEHYEENRSRRRERTGLRSESEQMMELRKLEQKINKQLSSHEIGWDERSVRHLEKNHAQSFKDDEKRTDKLQRIRSKNSSRRAISGGMEGGDVMIPESMMSRNRSISPEKGVDLQDGRAKYNHLKVLRQSRQMHKYMHRTGGARTSRHGVAPRPEAY